MPEVCLPAALGGCDAWRVAERSRPSLVHWLNGRLQPHERFLWPYEGMMKFCHVVLVISLGMTADLVLGAQTLSAGPVLVASEAMPEGILPDLLAGSGHDSL